MPTIGTAGSITQVTVNAAHIKIVEMTLHIATVLGASRFGLLAIRLILCFLVLRLAGIPTLSFFGPVAAASWHLFMDLPARSSNRRQSGITHTVVTVRSCSLLHCSLASGLFHADSRSRHQHNRHCNPSHIESFT